MNSHRCPSQDLARRQDHQNMHARRVRSATGDCPRPPRCLFASANLPSHQQSSNANSCPSLNQHPARPLRAPPSAAMLSLLRKSSRPPASSGPCTSLSATANPTRLRLTRSSLRCRQVEARLAPRLRGSRRLRLKASMSLRMNPQATNLHSSLPI